jgi:hypothetical protein
MLAQMVANDAAASNAFSRMGSRRAIVQRSILIVLVCPLLVGCAVTIPVKDPDPANPTAKVAGVGYVSTTRPYVSLRPVAPVGWREQNERVAPTPKNEQ